MSKAVTQLVTAMQEELQSQQKLAGVLEDKLQNMRQYNTTRLEALAISERRLVAAARAAALKRNLAVQQLSTQLFPQRQKPASARELAAACDEPGRSQILSMSAMLAQTVEKTARLNRVTAVAARKVLGHIDHVFRAIAQSGRDIGLYGRAGQKNMLEQNRLIDAIA